MHSQHSYRLLRTRGALAIAVIFILATIALPSISGAKSQPKCLFVSSYHKGYSWSDGVERGLRSVLAGQCELRQFDMDTKRHKSEKEKIAAAIAAKTLVEKWKPDIVITADDNAAKYFIKPYFKDHAIPIVFAGVNWTAREYGFPYTNVTGIVEVAPIQPMLLKARDIAAGTRAFYLGADTLTERRVTPGYVIGGLDQGPQKGTELRFRYHGEQLWHQEMGCPGSGAYRDAIF
jgi:hypothetical protein